MFKSIYGEITNNFNSMYSFKVILDDSDFRTEQHFYRRPHHLYNAFAKIVLLEYSSRNLNIMHNLFLFIKLMEKRGYAIDKQINSLSDIPEFKDYKQKLQQYLLFM